MIEYVIGWKLPVGIPAISGSLTHALIAQKLGGIPEIVEGYELLPDHEIRMAERRAEAAIDWLESKDAQVLRIEAEATGECNDVPIIGYIDLEVRIDGETVGIDWKTGRGDLRQLGVYAHLRPEVDRWLFVGLASPKNPVVIEWDGDRSWLPDVTNRIKEALTQREQPVNPGWWCSFCPVRRSCREVS